ncbi:MAG: 2-oxoacid:acceptor oxidoreductase family protein [Candidatus Altarchaeum sp.]|nr:2-oxoacid:acceptor oxidoreductase family protein [Candidatus Altarchaeum sp.]
MINVVFFGRGGQGAVIASELLAKAVFKDNKFAQAFPSFGVERRGAPVQAFCKIDTQFIKSREQIYDPDYVIIFEPSLMDQVNVKESCKIIINSEKDYNTKNVFRVNATKIAIETLGVPIVNTSMLGAFCATKEVSLESMKETIIDKFGKRAEKNLIAAERLYNNLKAQF